MDNQGRRGPELKIDRVRRGLRQYTVAAAVGMPQTTLCAIENGRRPVSPDEADRIGQAIRLLGTATVGSASRDHGD